MPQMAPTLWIYISVSLFTILLVNMTYLYFFKHTESMKNYNKYLSPSVMNWLW